MNTDRDVKVIITGAADIDKYMLADRLAEMMPGMKVADMCTTDRTAAGGHMRYMDPGTVGLSYKNNALICVASHDSISECMTFDDFDASDIAVMSMEQFNMTADYVFQKYDVLTVWLDFPHEGHTDRLMTETKYMSERLDLLKYMYFNEDEPDVICRRIYEYVNAEGANEKNRLLAENS
jgi:hypothetical protein